MRLGTVTLPHQIGKKSYFAIKTLTHAAVAMQHYTCIALHTKLQLRVVDLKKCYSKLYQNVMGGGGTESSLSKVTFVVKFS